MKNLCALLLLLLLFPAIQASAQTRISGCLKTKKDEPVTGANLFLMNTYDGTSTDTAGKFSFITKQTGVHIIRYSAIGYITDSIRVELNGKPLNLNLQIKEAANELNLVTISAGTLEASDTKKGAVLSPTDVATTAGAVADIVAALQTLPGTSQAFSENGLFVRGGAASETQTYFDGMLVKDPFSSQLPDIASRSRFSPFLFKGTTFSTGGYSAQYGQALSSALLLESKDIPEKTSTEFSLLSVGVGAAHTERMKNSSLTIGGNYYNLQPAYSVIKQNTNWAKAPAEAVGNLQYKWKPTKTALLKIFTQYSDNTVSLFIDSPGVQSLKQVTDQNKSYYFNTTYQDYFSRDWKIQAGFSYSNTHEKGNIDSNTYRINDDLLQGRLTLTRYIGKRSLIMSGAEVSAGGRLESWNLPTRTLTDDMQAGFVEGEFYLSDILVVRTGVRTEHSSYLSQWNAAPRTSLALKTGSRSQVSLAYGVFYQNPDERYLIQSHSLGYEKAIHYLLNYQYLSNERTFRIEAYYKKYAQLTKYDFNGITSDYSVVNYSGLNNGGAGFARGLDIFWRDKKSIPDGDYWISYSYLDIKRDFRDYPVQATPPFAARHTLNVVYKEYISVLKSQIGATYSFSSGRTYYNPNNPVFLGDKTKNYNNLSLNISYLTRLLNQFTILYISVNNLPGFTNIYGYNYSANGQFRDAITPTSRRNFLVGLFVTIGDNTFNH